MKKTNVVIGSDIELFLYDKKNKKYKSIIGYINAGKNNPLKLERKGCSIQEDGVALEYNVNPTTNPEEMWDDIEYILNETRKFIPNSYDYKIISSAEFEDEELDHPLARIAGCTADYNAWKNGEENKPPVLAKTNLRTTGGHLHIDVPESLMYKLPEFVKILDFFLGIPSLLLDEDTERRKLYGKAGCFRVTNFGVEYRTLSNFWTKNKELVEWVFDNVNRAYNYFVKGNNINMLLERMGIEEDEIIIEEIINSNDKKLAAEITNYWFLLPQKEDEHERMDTRKNRTVNADLL